MSVFSRLSPPWILNCRPFVVRMLAVLAVLALSCALVYYSVVQATVIGPIRRPTEISEFAKPRPNEAIMAQLRVMRESAHVARLVQLGLALRDYVADHKRLPPAAILAKDGKPLLSWRVALLPYLGFGDLYKRFKLDQPWDSADNKKAAQKMPGVYGQQARRQPGLTGYLALVGPGTVFEKPEGIAPGQIEDGPANTLLIGATSSRVLWSKPEELACTPGKSIPALENLVLFGDGLVRVLDKDIDENTRRALVTRNGGETIDASRVRRVAKRAEANGFNQASWDVVRHGGPTPERYRFALRLALEAHKLATDDGNILNTLGVAQYRVGRYEDALKTLTQADALNSKARNGSLVEDLAFLCMCHQRLGHKKEAAAYFGRLREKRKQSAQTADQEYFFLEAKELMEARHVQAGR